jgi:thiol-disulfide isomerase/thioredoxin
MSGNFFEVKSSEQFKEFLSADLNRISIISFWASWAEPCRQMNELVKELAKKNHAALFLQVCNEIKILKLHIKQSIDKIRLRRRSNLISQNHLISRLFHQSLSSRYVRLIASENLTI